MLTRGRVSAEARTLGRCLRAGVSVPGVRMVDESAGLIALEEIHGKTVREVLGGNGEGDLDEDESENQSLGNIDVQNQFGVTIEEVMFLIGQQLAKMHTASIIHGDLTTSNMILRRREFSSTSSTSINLWKEFPAEIVSGPYPCYCTPSFT
ncbi:uncharacterized protein EI90DRAFT_3043568 [Cantharellus anzutake]|uniref:uncharacterized protein n=1 Tax=Cantharellus anzutake TaxID=1750568 RepID=UPI0019059211|nr:uncharacterized protein EI90DRAFT_3043568 [Cantharellus anzutake]KAF8337609.1 hypothetical protein EI90DRAFT_3043568 [Cantharellus anzutake]